MKISRIITIGAAVVVAGIAAIVFFSGSAANLNCDEIASEAQRISQNQATPIKAITNVRETSRSLGRGTGEGRCEGTAELNDGSSQTVYLRAYEEGSNLMVEYSPTPFEPAAAE